MQERHHVEEDERRVVLERADLRVGAAPPAPFCGESVRRLAQVAEGWLTPRLGGRSAPLDGGPRLGCFMRLCGGACLGVGRIADAGKGAVLGGLGFHEANYTTGGGKCNYGAEK